MPSRPEESRLSPDYLDLALLRPILQAWRDKVRHYSSKVRYAGKQPKRRDAIYWHGERANVGCLAAAAWQCGGTALEEYRGKKMRKGRHGTDKGSGRIDLWLWVKGLDYKGIAVEAKSKELRLATKGRKRARSSAWLLKAVKGCLKSAMVDAAKLDSWYTRTLALAFVHPAIMKGGKSKKSVVEEGKKRFLAAAREVDHDIFWWASATDSTEDAHGPWDKDYHYPGVLLIGRVCQGCGRRPSRQR